MKNINTNKKIIPELEIIIMANSKYKEIRKYWPDTKIQKKNIDNIKNGIHFVSIYSSNN